MLGVLFSEGRHEEADWTYDYDLENIYSQLWHKDSKKGNGFTNGSVKSLIAY